MIVRSEESAPGRPVYQIHANEDEILDLADGIVQESLSRAAHDALSWRREQARVIARRK